MTNNFKQYIKYFLTFTGGAVFVLLLVLGSMYLEEPETVVEKEGRVFREVKQLFDKSFYTEKEVSEKDLEYGIIKGFVEAHGDKHSQFFPPRKAQDFREFIEGDFEGIGAYVEEHELGILIDRVIAGSPAKASGITSGDIIITANEQELSGLPLEEAISYIKGPKGTQVELEIVRPGNEELMVFSVIRDTVIIPSVEEIPTDRKDVVVIGLRSFMGNSFSLFRDQLQASISETTKAIIVDLRDNGGGLLSSSIDVSSLFLKQGSRVVEIRGNSETIETIHTNRPQVTDLPLVILVNENSASASEIVAGAMQDHKRAFIIGTTTYGKGSVQVSRTLSDGSELKFTTDHWFTPLGRAIEGVGVVPDMEVEYTFEDFSAGKDPQLDAALEYIDQL